MLLQMMITVTMIISMMVRLRAWAASMSSVQLAVEALWLKLGPAGVSSDGKETSKVRGADPCDPELPVKCPVKL